MTSGDSKVTDSTAPLPHHDGASRQSPCNAAENFSEGLLHQVHTRTGATWCRPHIQHARLICVGLLALSLVGAFYSQHITAEPLYRPALHVPAPGSVEQVMYESQSTAPITTAHSLSTFSDPTGGVRGRYEAEAVQSAQNASRAQGGPAGGQDMHGQALMQERRRGKMVESSGNATAAVAPPTHAQTGQSSSSPPLPTSSPSSPSLSSSSSTSTATPTPPSPPPPPSPPSVEGATRAPPPLPPPPSSPQQPQRNTTQPAGTQRAQDQRLSVVRDVPEIHPGWLRFPQGADSETADVQASIDANQNPAKCSAAKYLVWRLNNYGMGSDLHTIGWALGYAMMLNRTLVYDVNRAWVYTDDSACKGTRTPDCYFLPLSKCQGEVTPQEMANAKNYGPLVNRPQPKDLYGDDPYLASERVLRMPFKLRRGFPRDTVPLRHRDQDLSWWRAQSIKYIVRPNPELHEWVKQYMSTAFAKVEARSEQRQLADAPKPSKPEAATLALRGGNTSVPLSPFSAPSTPTPKSSSPAQSSSSPSSPTAAAAAVGAPPSPSPPSTPPQPPAQVSANAVATTAPPESATCIHVRHGDKWKEMTLLPLRDFLEAAVAMMAIKKTSRNIFLTTDDESVIQEVEEGHWSEAHNMTFYYLRYERRNDLSPVDTARTEGASYFARVSLANLFLGVHPSCTSFVQTTGSNWNRLINELRKTDGVRHDALWADLTPGEWRRRGMLRKG